MNFYKKLVVLSFFLIGSSQADNANNYKEELELVERIASRMVVEASQHARCFALASLAKETLIAKLHFAHGTDVLQINRFKEIANEEMDLLNANTPNKKDIEMFAYERYNTHCRHMYLGRPK